METWFWVWIGLAAVCVVAEMFVPTFFLFPFGVGAGASALLNWMGFDVGWQLVAFVAVSVPVLFLSRSLAARVRSEGSPKLVSDRLVDEVGSVLEDIPGDHGSGLVRVNGEEWTATSEDGVAIAAPTRVRVLRVSGVRLIVQPVT